MKTTTKLYRLLVCASAVASAGCGPANWQGPATQSTEQAEASQPEPADAGLALADAGETPADAGTKRCVVSWAADLCCQYEG